MTVLTVIVAVVIFLLATLLSFVAGYKSGYIGCIEKFRETLEVFKNAVDMAEEMKKKKEGMANADDC